MDSQHSPWNLTATCTTLAFILIPIIFFFFVFLIKKSKPVSVKQLPPGPPTLPFIGNIHLLSSIPFRSFRDLANQYGPIMHLKLGDVPAIVVSSPEMAKEILKDNDPKFAGRPESIGIKIMWYNYASVSFAPYGDYWRQMRKIINVEMLNSKMVRYFGSIRDEEVARLIKSIHLSGGEPVSLTDKIFSMSSSITCRAAFGEVLKDSGSLITVMKQVQEKSMGFLVADLFPSSRILDILSWPTKRRLVLTRRKLDMFLDDIINQHKRNRAKIVSENGDQFGNEALVDVLLRMKESGELQIPIGNDNIKAVLFDVFTAGTESSSAVIDWIMTELMRNPLMMAKAQAEVRQVFKENNNIIEECDVHKLKYLKLIILEAFRLHPSAPLIPRASREECEINGYTIPAKVKVFVNIWAIQRDPKYWNNPESFEPERFENLSIDYTGGDFEYLPFGSGKRMCPGITFGLANIELPLAQLLYNFDWKLSDGVKPQDLNMIERFGLISSRKDKLSVVATPYQPLA